MVFRVMESGVPGGTTSLENWPIVANTVMVQLHHSPPPS
jgi:hypothetical protein